MKAVYGPVASWRLGLSLGIDPILPPKTCSFNCVYCQLGETEVKIGSPKEFKPRLTVRQLLKELKEASNRVDWGKIQHITFSGVGEPTLNPRLARLAEAVKKSTDKPLAILTNASTLSDAGVRRGLRFFDLVVAKLDAPTQELFEAVNRPAPGISLNNIVEGLKALRREFSGSLALQIMLYQAEGYPSNSSVKAVEGLAELASEIMPDEVQVNTPLRPPSQRFVAPLPFKRLEKLAGIFKSRLPGVKVVYRRPPEALKPRGLGKPMEAEVLELIRRRPCRAEEIAEVLEADFSMVKRCLRGLVAKGLAEHVKVGGFSFYRVVKA